MEANTVGEPFFSMKKLFWAFVYDTMLIGIFSAVVFFQVRFLDRDVEVGSPPSHYRK